MRIARVSVQNFRCLQHVEVALARFCCFIGKNNAGKSTLLQAIRLFFEPAKLCEQDYHDPGQPVRIAVHFTDISDNDLSLLATEHRDDIVKILSGRSLTLVRLWDTEGKHSMAYEALVPNEQRFTKDFIDAALKGTRGPTLQAVLQAHWSEILVDPVPTTQTAARQAIDKLMESIPIDQKVVSDKDLPTGIPESVTKFLPSAIYIPGSKDLDGYLKTTGSAPFAKMLALLFEMLSDELHDVEQALAAATKRFSRTTSDNGTLQDNRSETVKNIESTVQDFLRQCFAGISVEIEMPPPDLRTFFGNAQIILKDGVRGPVESKGDGLRRATVFSIFRTYAKMSLERNAQGETNDDFHDRHILLFEEPELYLHPAAQKALVDALRIFSEQHHVFFTTHSPSFLAHSNSDSMSFIKVIRHHNSPMRPFSTVVEVNLDDLSDRESFRLICHDNNNAAFFYDNVVLVEGISDHIVFPHIASLILEDWVSIGHLYKIVRLNGKNDFRAYNEFFKRFGVNSSFITDLDVLVDRFDNFCDDASIRADRNTLYDVLKDQVRDSGVLDGIIEPNERAKRERKEILNRLAVASGETEVLKRRVVSSLRQIRIFVLEKGALEAYYPSTVHRNGNKHSMAHDFCTKVRSRTDALSLCSDIADADGNLLGNELEVICSGVYSGAVSAFTED